MKLPRRGRYTGRLAFDPDSGFHIDPKGRRLVTLDDGKTWRYARRSDSSHIERYSKRVVVIDGTANAFDPEPHHYQAQPDDPHYDETAPFLVRPKTDPDDVAATITSHTEAYRD